jgi:hypothetical protein
MTTPVESAFAARRFLIYAAITLLIATIILFLLIFAGIFDPKPIGRLSIRDDLERRESVEDTFLTFIPHRASSNDYSIRLTASWIGGNPDIGYGLAIGDGLSNAVVAVSPTGYATITELPLEGDIGDSGRKGNLEPRPEIPWRTWPHVKIGSSSNEIWLDIEDSEVVAVRINRELLWEGNLPLTGNKIGLWAESYDGPAVIEFYSIELFQPS